jgi:AMP-polyphosphate phosphotransferase
MLDKIDLNQKIAKSVYKQVRPELYRRLYDVQKATWLAGIPVIILVEGWHASGKAKILRHLTSPLDPRAFKLYPAEDFSSNDKNYPWLRRYWLNLPSRGEWVIFDGAWYRRVSDERIHKKIPEKNWRRAYRDIVEFERTLTNDGYIIQKFFLHISSQEQKRRHFTRIKDPLTPKQTTDEIWEQQQRFDEWQTAFLEIFERTDTEWVPWNIIEATNNRFAVVKILGSIINELENQLELPFAPLSDSDMPINTLFLDKKFPLPYLDKEFRATLDDKPNSDNDTKSPNTILIADSTSQQNDIATDEEES